MALGMVGGRACGRTAEGVGSSPLALATAVGAGLTVIDAASAELARSDSSGSGRNVLLEAWSSTCGVAASPGAAVGVLACRQPDR
eukprot:2873788-Prymnesium_polylepis.1